MSINANIEHVKRLLSDKESSLSQLDNWLADSKTLKDRVYGMAVLQSFDAGLGYIILGDFKRAKEYFFKTLTLHDKEVELRPYKTTYDPLNYALVLQGIRTAVLTLDKPTMEKVANRFDLSLTLDQWPNGSSRPFYCLIKALAGLMLDWDKKTMLGIKEQSEKMRRRRDVDGVLDVIWDILELNLDALKEHFKTVTRSESHSKKGVEEYISAKSMVLLILAKDRGLNLEDFDPPFTSKEYIGMYSRNSTA